MSLPPVHGVNTSARRIMVAIPSHACQVDTDTQTALIQVARLCQAIGWPLDIEVWGGDSILPRSRNILLAKFWRGNYTDLVWLDADIAFPPEDLVTLLTRPVDFAAGLYRHKMAQESYPARWLPEVTADPKTGLMEAEAVPFGFVRMTRTVVEQMIEAHKDKPYFVREVADLPCWWIFDYEYRDGDLFGEDYTFCHKWRRLGGKVWVDPFPRLAHIGRAVYRGQLFEFLTKRKDATSIPVEGSDGRLKRLAELMEIALGGDPDGKADNQPVHQGAPVAAGADDRNDAAQHRAAPNRADGVV